MFILDYQHENVACVFASLGLHTTQVTCESKQYAQKLKGENEQAACCIYTAHEEHVITVYFVQMRFTTHTGQIEDRKALEPPGE